MKIEETPNLSLSSNSSSQSAISPSTSRTNFLFPRLLLELALPEDQSIQRSLPSARSTCVNSATARVMWAGHSKLFLDRSRLQGQSVRASWKTLIWNTNLPKRIFSAENISSAETDQWYLIFRHGSESELASKWHTSSFLAHLYAAAWSLKQETQNFLDANNRGKFRCQ